MTTKHDPPLAVGHDASVTRNPAPAKGGGLGQPENRAVEPHGGRNRGVGPRRPATADGGASPVGLIGPGYAECRACGASYSLYDRPTGCPNGCSTATPRQSKPSAIESVVRPVVAGSTVVESGGAPDA